MPGYTEYVCKVQHQLLFIALKFPSEIWEKKNIFLLSIDFFLMKK